VETQRVAKALLIFDDDLGLLLRRCLADEHRPGEFDLPGGEINKNEGLARGMAREIFEETGLVVTKNQLHVAWRGESLRHRHEGMRLVLRRLFVVDLSSLPDFDINLAADEHDYFELLPVSDLADRLNHPDWSHGVRSVRQAAFPERPKADIA
jgi:8-oxo-dGTP pyrophosphatase MutT (NUDIX family)